MRVQSVGQENNTKSSGVLRAGLAGAAGGVLVRNFTPLTTKEHDFYFNSSAKQAIKTKVNKVRLNEVEKITSEYKNGSLKLADGVFDVFETHKDTVVNEPKKLSEYIKDSSDAVKNGVKSLVSRVDSVGTAKEHIEVSNIKSAAKSARPLAFFVAAGALIAMTGQVIVNAVKSAKTTKDEAEENENRDLTMADILLEGLGSNTEVLYLSEKAAEKAEKKD